MPRRRVTLGWDSMRPSCGTSAAFADAGSRLVRLLRAAAQREVAGDSPDDDQDEQDDDADEDPAPPVRLALRRLRLRAGALEPGRLAVGAAGCPLRFGQRRNPPLDASSPVDAVGLFSLGHWADYRSRVPEQRAIGVDVGGTKIAAGVVDRRGRIERRVERPTPTESQDELLAALDEIVEGLLVDGVAAIGFGLPSTIDQRAGRIVSSVHVPLGDFDFRERMAERFSLPVALDNDANAAAIAEWKVGAGRGSTPHDHAHARHGGRRRPDPGRKAVPRLRRSGCRDRPHGARVRR